MSEASSFTRLMVYGHGWLTGQRLDPKSNRLTLTETNHDQIVCVAPYDHVMLSECEVEDGEITRVFKPLGVFAKAGEAVLPYGIDDDTIHHGLQDWEIQEGYFWLERAYLSRYVTQNGVRIPLYLWRHWLDVHSRVILFLKRRAKDRAERLRAQLLETDAE